MRARWIHKCIAAIRDVYAELFFAGAGPHRRSSVIIKEGFKLTFDSSYHPARSSRATSSTQYSAKASTAPSAARKRANSVSQIARRFRLQRRGAGDWLRRTDRSSILELICAPSTPRCRIAGQLRKHANVKQLYDFYGRSAT